MEEVDGSNPSRSTTTFQTLTVLLPAKNLVAGVQLFGIARDRKHERNGSNGGGWMYNNCAGESEKEIPAQTLRRPETVGSLPRASRRSVREVQYEAQNHADPD